MPFSIKSTLFLQNFTYFVHNGNHGNMQPAWFLKYLQSFNHVMALNFRLAKSKIHVVQLFSVLFRFVIIILKSVDKSGFRGILISESQANKCFAESFRGQEK